MIKEIIHYFKKEIYSGNLKPGQKLQSRHFYEIKFKTSKKTMEKVISFLELSGFIISIPRKGYFVQDIEKQKWWRSENHLNNFDVKIEKEDIVNNFSLQEIKEIFGLDGKVNLNNYYSYKKIYLINNEVKKVQFSWILKSLFFKKEEFRKSFYHYLWKNNIKDESRFEVIKGGIKIPNSVEKVLKTNQKKGIVVFVLIKNEKNIPIQIVKTFRKDEDINIKHMSYIL